MKSMFSRALLVLATLNDSKFAVDTVRLNVKGVKLHSDIWGNSHSDWLILDEEDPLKFKIAETQSKLLTKPEINRAK